MMTAETRVRTEIIAELPKATALTFLENDIESVSLLPSSIISALNIPPSNEKLELKLSFRNHRVTVPHRFGPHDLKLEIDCTHYSTGPDDYELEVELSSPEIYPEVMDSLAQLLGSLEIPVIFHARSKFARGLLRLSPKERPKKITP